MYCRFCGNEILNDSIFCSRCGKNLKCEKNTKARTKKSTNKSIVSKIPEDTLSNIFYICILVFFVLWWKMAPCYGLLHFIFFIIGIGATIALAIAIEKWRDKCDIIKSNKIAIICCLILLIPSIGLRIIYEVKVDTVNADIPENGQVYLELDINEDYYTYGNPKLIKDPSVSVIIGDNIKDGNHISNIFKVTLNQEYTATIGVEGTGGSGDTTKNVTFTSDNLKNSYTLHASGISFGQGCFAEIDISFKRICLFWDVIFY